MAMTALTTRKTEQRPVIARSSHGRTIRKTRITDAAAITQSAWTSTGNALRDAMDSFNQTKR